MLKEVFDLDQVPVLLSTSSTQGLLTHVIGEP